MNIPVVAATGNSFNGQQGEGFAAIVTDTISVTATDLSGHLLSERPAARLVRSAAPRPPTIAAPGEGLTAPSGDTGTATVEGTSFATPLVTGAVVLLQQIYESRFGTLPTVDQLKSWLQQGSDPINDSVTGITIGQLDIPKAAALIPDGSVAVRPPRHQPATIVQVTARRSVVPPWSRPAQTITTSTATVSTPASASTPAAGHRTPASATTPTPTPTPDRPDCQRRPRRPRDPARRRTRCLRAYERLQRLAGGSGGSGVAVRRAGQAAPEHEAAAGRLHGRADS